MQLSILTWNSHDIQGVTYETSVPPGQLSNLQANGITAIRTDDWPNLSTTIIDSDQTFTINIKIKSGTFSTQREELKSWFSIVDKVRHDLIAEDTSDLNNPHTQWFLRGLPIQFVELRVGWYAVTLHVEMKAWRMVTPIDEVWNVTGTGDTFSFDVLGNIPSKPIIKIKPVDARTGGGPSNTKWMPIYNVLDTVWSKPFDITDGGFDTASLVGGGDMQASGDDLVISLDGIAVNRWLSAMNTSATLIWINLALSPRQEAAIASSISGGGTVTAITFAKNDTNLVFLTNLAKAPNKILLIDNEAFIFEAVDTANYQVTSSVDMRAAKYTSAGAHSAGTIARWIEHDIWMTYGNPDATPPVLNDGLKPMFDLDNSTNGLLVYTQYKDFFQTGRPMMFEDAIINTGVPNKSFQYSGDLTADDFTVIGVNPAIEMGCLFYSKDWATIVAIYTQMQWSIFHPSGFTNVLYSGSKKFWTPTGQTWPGEAGCEKSQDSISWTVVSNEGTPAGATWEAFGPHDDDLGGSYPYLRFIFSGTLSTLASGQQMASIQFDTVTLTVDTTRLPVVALNGSNDNNPINAKISNNNTGEYLLVNTLCKTDEYIIVDCENRKVYYSDGSNRFEALGWSPGRSNDDWLNCPKDTNEWQYDDDGVNGVEVTITHRDRMI